MRLQLGRSIAKPAGASGQLDDRVIQQAVLQRLTRKAATLRDRETQTVVGCYDGSWTTDRHRALDLRKREVAEAHVARMRERQTGVGAVAAWPPAGGLKSARQLASRPCERAGFAPPQSSETGGFAALL